jgi:hypothetical protein
MPADNATPGPINTSLPIEMYCSLKIVVGFHMIMLRLPNDANFLLRELCGPIDAQKAAFSLPTVTSLPKALPK